jgi:asparagine synthase (glutamine-hydrolysing)
VSGFFERSQPNIIYHIFVSVHYKYTLVVKTGKRNDYKRETSNNNTCRSNKKETECRSELIKVNKKINRMCGIFAIFSSSYSENELRKLLIQCSSQIRHRGPDWSGYKVLEGSDSIGATSTKVQTHGIAHERLAIIDPESGSQPLISPDGSIIVAANGEIYNYKEVYDELEKDAIAEGKAPYKPLTGSDCEVILPLYEKYGPTIDLPNKLRGMFSFILFDRTRDIFYIVRDHIGIIPLYVGWSKVDGSIYVGSELKTLHEQCNQFQQFPPGHIYTNALNRTDSTKPLVFQRWFSPNWAPDMVPGGPLPKEKFQSVRCQQMFLIFF